MFHSALVIALFVACSSEPDATQADPDAAAQSAPNCSRLTTPCEAGGACEGAADCTSNACRDGVCIEVKPADGSQNNGETDVDCGGPQAPACADGKKCEIAADCTSGVCTGEICQAPSPKDGVKNGDETDLDCGGQSAPKCAQGRGCATDADCDDLKCNASTKKCDTPSHEDGFKNGDETGVDCGGPTATKKCPPGEGCAGDGDCDNTRCNATAKTCDPPKKDDGLKNGTETDVDCGGGAPTNARRCTDGNKPSASEKCAVDGDCASGFCSWDKKCVPGRSCKGSIGNARSGITTCGQYETDNPLAATDDEYCCRSLPLPTTTTVKLDKYEVTAGRFRQFLESIPGYNVRKWVGDEIAANTDTGKRLAVDIPSNQRALLPASANPGEPLNVVIQTGALVMDIREPSTSQGCFTDWGDPNPTTGTYESGAYGAATYWWPQATLQAHAGDSGFGGPNKGRLHTKDRYDEKPINCAPYWLYAAFCAWDGGRLPSTGEMFEAYGTTYYPWNSNTYGSLTTTANYFNNQLIFYSFPGVTNAKGVEEAADARDLISYIGAPGRFVNDKTFKTSGSGESWFDMGANMMEITRYNTDYGTSMPIASCGNTKCDQSQPRFCDYSLSGTGGDGCPTGSTYRAGGTSGAADRMQVSLWVGGSWEGHFRFATSPEPYFARNSYNLAVQTQYGKTTVRCAR